MSNTDGGGALIVGVADDGTLVGTDLDAEWLRLRIYDHSQRMLTVAVGVHFVRGVRLLVLRCPEAIEPIRIDQKVRWRVNTSCVEVDPSTWHERRQIRLGFDWSAQGSSYLPGDVRLAALERARDFLRDSGEDHAQELAEATNEDLLSRLNVVTSDGRLTYAGAITFVGRETPALDYILRETAGGDSLNRIRRGRRSLLEELFDVEQAINSANPIRHLPEGLVSGQIRQLPSRAVREAVVNGCVHRDWLNLDPTLVEHTGSTLVVISPGGFVGGITPQNIITHPSQPRHRSLAELFAALRLGEREGIGFDRMVLDMVRFGYQPPIIEEIPGPHVRAALVARTIDESWMRQISRLDPLRLSRDLNSLLLLKRALEHWWVDVAVAAPLLQRSSLETEAAMEELAQGKANGQPIIEEVAGTPADAPRAWRISEEFLAALHRWDDRVGIRRRSPQRRDVALDYARARGRISSTELASIVKASPPNVGAVLKGLEQEGLLAPGRESRRGPGFFYVPVS